MLSTAAAVAFPPAASSFPPVKPACRGWMSSWSRRAVRVSAGYSQLEVREVTYRPLGTEQNLLNEISISLREKSFGLIFGRSGSGKTTILQLLAGLSQPTSGSICIQKYNDRGNPSCLAELLTSQRVGIVFRFPERQKADLAFKEWLAINLQNAFNSVGLGTISLDEDPQLIQTPDLLLLDEPLAGLDWKAGAGIVNLLKDLKKHHTISVTSHDLRELYPLVDRSWRMEMGGSLKEEALLL